eukprot:651483-Pelagomonas_calceolata.AAC.6
MSNAPLLLTSLIELLKTAQKTLSAAVSHRQQPLNSFSWTVRRSLAHLAQLFLYASPPSPFSHGDSATPAAHPLTDIPRLSLCHGCSAWPTWRSTFFMPNLLRLSFIATQLHCHPSHSLTPDPAHLAQHFLHAAPPAPHSDPPRPCASARVGHTHGQLRLGGAIKHAQGLVVQGDLVALAGCLGLPENQPCGVCVCVYALCATRFLAEIDWLLCMTQCQC